jgi:hypothetical protein
MNHSVYMHSWKHENKRIYGEKSWQRVILIGKQRGPPGYLAFCMNFPLRSSFPMLKTTYCHVHCPTWKWNNSNNTFFTISVVRQENLHPICRLCSSFGMHAMLFSLCGLEGWATFGLKRKILHILCASLHAERQIYTLSRQIEKKKNKTHVCLPIFTDISFFLSLSLSCFRKCFIAF